MTPEDWLKENDVDLWLSMESPTDAWRSMQRACRVEMRRKAFVLLAETHCTYFTKIPTPTKEVEFSHGQWRKLNEGIGLLEKRLGGCRTLADAIATLREAGYPANAETLKGSLVFPKLRPDLCK